MAIAKNQQPFGDISEKERAVLARLAINPRGFVFDPGTGHSFAANETAAAFLRLLQSESAPEEILSKIQSEFDIGKKELEKEMVEFFHLVKTHFL